MSDSKQTASAAIKPLEGKLALVTGGSRGIGAAISRQLAAAGATVLVNYSSSEAAARDVVRQITADGGRAKAIGGNVANGADVKKIFATIDAEHGGKLDILVNNAGVYLTAPLAEFTDELFQKSFDVNVKSVFQVTREASRRLVDGGRVINIGSIVGERALGAGLAVYSATKFAVAGLSRGFAHEFAPGASRSTWSSPARSTPT